MKIKDGFVLRAVAGTNMVVPLGSQVVDFGSIIKLSDTGAFLWDKLSSEQTTDSLVDALTAEYDVDTEKATADVNAFLTKLKDAGLVD